MDSNEFEISILMLGGTKVANRYISSRRGYLAEFVIEQLGRKIRLRVAYNRAKGSTNIVVGQRLIRASKGKTAFDNALTELNKQLSK